MNPLLILAFMSMMNQQNASTSPHNEEKFFASPASLHIAELEPEEDAKEVICLAKKMATIMKDKLGCDGFNLVQNNGEAAGQTVFHFHMHLIPRYENDGQEIGWKPGSPSQDELEEIKKQIAGE